MRRPLALALALLGMLWSAGCYSIPDSALAARYDSIYVPTLENLTFEPGLHTRVTRALRREFQNDGQLRLVNSAETADLVLTGKLTLYSVRATAYDDNDNPVQFNITIGGEVAVHEARGGAPVWSKTIGADDFYQVRRRRTGLLARDRPAGLDEAAEEFAELVVFDFVDSAW